MYTKDARGEQIRNKDLRGRETADLGDDMQKVREKMIETRDAISQTASHAKKRAEELLHTSIHDMKEKSADLQENVVTYVKSNPVKSVAFAILGGLIVSHLLRK